MRTIRSILLCVAALAAPFYFIHAQSSGSSTQQISAEDMATVLEALEQTTSVPASSLPRGGMVGTFWSAQHAPGTRFAWPPLPENIWGLDVWPLGDGTFILDDRNVDYVALQAEADAEAELASPMMRSSMMMSSLSSSYAYGNPVYLTNLVVSAAGYSPMTASFSIAGGTNFVPYNILTTTNLLNKVADWNWLGIGYTGNGYNFSDQPTSQAFYMLAKPAKTMVVAWGENYFNQCDVPSGITNAVMVAGGGGYTMALLNNGTVVGWGGRTSEGSVPTNLTGVAMIASGINHKTVLLTNGMVMAWGDDFFGECDVPADLTNATVISAQFLHTLALRANGTVVSWGDIYSLAGLDDVPAGLSNVTAIAAGGEHNLAVSNGIVLAWGDDSNGQCDVPSGLSNVWDVAAGDAHSVALKKDGTVVAWGDNTYGESTVPAGLTNVVAIVAGGYPDYCGYTLAIKRDGTMVAWGKNKAAASLGGLNNVIALGAEYDSGLAIRTGPRTPVITLEPVDEYQVQGSNVTFTAWGAGLYGVTYQWQTNGVNLSGATNAALTLTNVQSAQLSISYNAVVTDNAGTDSITSSNAQLYFVTAPVINSLTLPTNQTVIYQSNLVLTVNASAPGMTNGFPLSYQWQFNGTNIGGNSASYTIHANVNSGGTYSVRVSNAVGSTNAAWQVTVYSPYLVLTQQPTNRYQIAGGTVTFGGGGISSGALTYQWAFNGTNLSGATNAALILTNVSAAQEGSYHFVVSDGIGSLTSSNASFYLVTPPTILSQSLPTNIVVTLQTNVSLSINASAPGRTNGFPLHYQWQFSGTSLGGAVSTNYTFSAGQSGIYSVMVTNAAGSTNASWNVSVLYPGSVWAWGEDDDGESDAPAVTNFLAIAAGEYHSVGVKDDGSVVQWGYDWGEVPADLTNVIAVAAGYDHSLALRSNGTVLTWGDAGSSANVQTNLSGVKAIACGWNHNVALLTNGMVKAWGLNAALFGWHLTEVPADLTNATAVAAGGLHSLALRDNGTVVAWGYNADGETNIPVGLSNVVMVAAGGQHSLALKADGTIVAWGDNNSGQCDVPAGLSNVMAIAAGSKHSVALKNDGTIICWGDNGDGQTTVASVLNNAPVKLITAGGNHTMAALFSPLVQYPVDVTKDLLLIYNPNSADSTFVKDYYLAHRPMIAGANVLGISCTNLETFLPAEYTNVFAAQIQSWLATNPTKRPQYVILFHCRPIGIDSAGYLCGFASKAS